MGTLHEGEPTGRTTKIDHGIDAYIATAPEGKSKGAGIVFLPDVFGIWQNSKLMADMFARRGYTTVVPDVFNGDPIPLPRPENFDFDAWKSGGSTGDNPHTPESVEPLVVAGIKVLQDMGFGSGKIGAVGYCIGAKYLVENFKNGIDVGYVAHPSYITDEELAAISGPLSIAAAYSDPIFPPDKRHKSEEILVKTGKPFQINVYTGVGHGFAVRGDPKVQSERYGREQAFLQAVAWFDEYLVGS